MTAEVIEAILANFRGWLCDLAAGIVPEPPELPEEPIDLHTLLGQFTALRHEVNLQTKSVRAQQEQSAETLKTLEDAVERLDEPEADEQPDDAALRPVLKALVDVYDALALGRQEVERLEQTTRAALNDLRCAVAPTPGPRTFWSRWFDGSKKDAERLQLSAARADALQPLLDSVLTGYRMSLQRLERVVQQQGLEPISCVGEPFDPERMEVVEAMADSGRPAGEVLGVGRPGYILNGKVFRYAQVRVAR